MKKLLPSVLVAAAALAAPAAFADTWAGATSGSWNIDTNWLDGTKPASEAVVFDGNSTANLTQTFDGAFTVTGITVGSPTGAITVANGTGGSLNIGSGGIDMSAATQNLTFSNTVATGAAQSWNIAGGRTLTFNLASNTSFNLASVTKTGSGILLLNGANISGGTFEVSGGTTTIQGFSSLANGVASGATVLVDSGATFNVVRSSGNFTLSGTIRLDGGIWSIGAGTSTAATLNGVLDVTANGGTFSNLQNSSVGTTQAFNGTLTGSGSLGVKNEATVSGALIALGGNNGAFTGTVNINGATGQRIVRLNAANSGSASSVWNVASANTLQVNGVSVALGDLTGAGTVTTSTGTGTVTVGAKNNDSGFTGVISGATNVIKSGTGTWTVGGAGANTYTGTTGINAGTLVTAKTSALGTGAVTVAGGTLQVGATNVTGIASLTINSGTLDSATASGAIITTGSFSLTGGTWLLRSIADGVTATGGFTLAGGTIDLGLLSLTDKQNSGFSLIAGTGTASGLSFVNGDSGFTYSVDTNGDLRVTAVPEPSTYGLIGAGALATVALVRRRRKVAGVA